jgi:large subunit ribosomal protein L5
MVPRLKERYREEVVPALVKEFGYKNVMQAPRLEKIVLNVGLGEALQNPKALDSAAEDTAAITGQRPVITRAKKSIAAFKVRKGMSIGLTVTVRGDRMYELLDRMVNAALPRIRDFQGVSPYSFDGRGNYSLGIKEQLIFPEVDYDKIDRIRGFQVTVVTTARSDEEGKRLLELLGVPFARS